MRRITTTDADIDEHGTGQNGFTDGDAGAGEAATHLNADWFDNAQEEIARAVEGNGATVVADGDPANYFQLDDAIGETARIVSPSDSATYVLSGLVFTYSGISLNVTLSQGRMVYNGRRYYFTTAKLTAGGFNAWNSLTASRDHYFYIAPENPAALATPPNRRTVYMTRLDVANGAAAPSTPAGTTLIARLVTNGSGVTAATYYRRGTRLSNESNAWVALSPAWGDPSANSRTVLHPVDTTEIDLGYNLDEDNAGYFSRCHFRRIRLRSTTSSLFTRNLNERYTFTSTTTGGNVADNLIIDLATPIAYPDGTMVYVSIKGCARNNTDPTDNYSFRIDGHAQLDGGVISLEGSGNASSSPNYQDGNAAIADGVLANLRVDSSTQLNLRLTGHTTDSLFWFVEVHIMINAD